MRVILDLFCESFFFLLESGATPFFPEQLAAMHISRHRAFFSSRRTFDVMVYFDVICCNYTSLVLSLKGEGFFNKFTSPDPDPGQDNLTGGTSHGYTPSSVNKSSQSEQ